ncbi:group 1 truncated hemoglobin [Vogesella amnigena]|uniref:Group 1 truncated hemoglobin n=1 Tax=Vogesella amnigena TaxID=1507449 RepID=A0ABV7TX64_9NEIS
MLTLYDRLGGSDGIRHIVDDIVANHLANPVVNPRFAHVADLNHLREMAFQFFCMGSGGPQHYSGKDMLSAHRGMNISEQEYLAVMDDVLAALDKNKVDDTAKHDVIAILYSLKGDIIRQ